MERIQEILVSISDAHNSVLAIQLTENSSLAEITQAQADYYRNRMVIMRLLRELAIAIQENDIQGV